MSRSSSRVAFGERGSIENSIISPPQGRKRTLASPGKNAFSNAKNPEMLLGVTSPSATAGLDEWSSLSMEERAQEQLGGMTTRNRRKSGVATPEWLSQRAAKPGARASSPPRGNEAGVVKMAPSAVVGGRDAVTNARQKIAELREVRAAIEQTRTQHLQRRADLSPLYLAAVALVLAFLYALTLAPPWGGSSSAASTILAPAVDAVSPETQRHTDGGGGGGGGWGAGAPEGMQASPDAEYSDAEYPEVGTKEQNKWKSVEALDSQIRALDLEAASAESTLGEDDVEPKELKAQPKWKSLIKLSNLRAAAAAAASQAGRLVEKSASWKFQPREQLDTHFYESF